MINQHELERYANENMEDGSKNKVIKLYENHLSQQQKVKEKIEEMSLGKQLIDLCYNKNLTKLNLTSVGIAIALTYIQNFSNYKL